MNNVATVSNLRPPWPKGVSGNPGGRAVGARNRLQGDFLNALAEHFAEHGRDAIERVCKNKPEVYIRAVASLMPRQFEAADPFEGLDNEDIRTLMALVKAAKQRRIEGLEQPT